MRLHKLAWPSLSLVVSKDNDFRERTLEEAQTDSPVERTGFESSVPLLDSFQIIFVTQVSRIRYKGESRWVGEEVR